MATENTIMAAVARAGQTTIAQRRLRAARAGPVPLPRLARRADRGDRLELVADRRRRPAVAAATYRIGPDHIEVGSFIGMAAVTGGDVTIEGAGPSDLVPILPAFERLGIRVEVGGHERARPAGTGARDPGRPRRRDPEDRGRAVAGVPGRPHVDRGHRRDAGAGDDPDLREDVREPPVLRGQARLDGRADHPLRPAPRRRDAGRRSCTGSGCRAPTSAPGMAMLIAALCAEGTSTIGEHRPDRPRLRAHRRAAALARRAHRARRGVEPRDREHARVSARRAAACRVERQRRGDTSSRALPVLDHLLGVLARYARFDLRLEVAPGGAEAEIAAAGRALGEALPGAPRGRRPRPRLGARSGRRGARARRARRLRPAARRLERRSLRAHVGGLGHRSSSRGSCASSPRAPA